MTSTKKDPVVVVFQLTGANDYLNTIIPYPILFTDTPSRAFPKSA